MENYTGVKVLEIEKEYIDAFHADGKLSLNVFDGRLRLNKQQNLFLVLKDVVPKDQGGTASGIGRVKGDNVVKLSVSDKTSMGSIYPRNKEQIFATEALLDKDIKVVILSGPAGTGKTLITLAAGLHQLEQKRYERIILTRAMTQVGKNSLGYLPGDVSEKFMPFNQGYLCNIEYLLGGRSKGNIADLVEQMPIQFIPLQLVRGASWPNAFIVIDEGQNLDYHETLTIGTRVGENSKIVLLGDLQQRDIKISKEMTGIYKVANSPLAKEDPVVAAIELIKCERSYVAALFAKIFEEGT